MISQRWPELKIEILNRGVSGDRTTELLERWSRDCLGLQAEYLSIMVGCNDVWRTRTQWQGQRGIPLDEYTDNYRALLNQARDAGFKKIVLMSPTTIDDDLESDLNLMLVEYSKTVKNLAQEYKAIYVPAGEAFRQAVRGAPEIKWTTDGCHPTVAGHGVLASVWLETVLGTA